MTYFHTFLCFLLVLSSLLVTVSKNPVQAVIFMVTTFLVGGISLVLFHSEFFGIAFVIIYVGAIAVLFVFIIMMLEVKRYDSFLHDNGFENLIRYGTLFGIFSTLVYSLRNENICDDIFFENIFHANINLKLFDNFGNIDVLGQSLYNYYLVCVLISGIILLVALVGAIYLTFRFDNNLLTAKKEKSEQQLSRRPEHSVVFVKNYLVK